ncbi:hypothetical protein [Streptomyces sp. NPDC001268]|uniref:hypothetical protein n=1 Tax=Streptomyces sp. NPDC001268 TaxID=3364553 RepID=UPI0036992C78
MTAAAWDSGPCLWPDGPELDRQLAEADRAHVDIHGPQTRRPNAFDADPWHGYARPATARPRRFNPYQPINDVMEGTL